MLAGQPVDHARGSREAWASIRLDAEHDNLLRAPRVRSLLLVAGALACAISLTTLLTTPALGARAHGARNRFACTGPNSAHVPCHFATPSGNVRCLWTPNPSRVACVVVATGRAYRLRPQGRATAIRLKLRRRGETLPTDQQILFPGSLSCHDTRTMMTCNQDFGSGAFTLPLRAHAAH